MTAKSLLPLYVDRSARTGRDRLEILTTLIDGPSLDPLFRDAVTQIPRGHPVYAWEGGRLSTSASGRRGHVSRAPGAVV